MIDAIMLKDHLVAVIAKDVISGTEKRINANLFVDCTGDATLGYKAGADYHLGREPKSFANESGAPHIPDSLMMGFSNQWYAMRKDSVSSFPKCDWALQFSEAYHLDMEHGDWYWETGFKEDMLYNAEFIRDHNFRAIYGNWAWLKNNRSQKYANAELAWLAFISGKRESRRLVGDIMLTEHDVANKTVFPDGFIRATWGTDLHYPDVKNTQYFSGSEFLSWADRLHYGDYMIPYRCLYSNTIPNLFMAGRNISVTHIALGSVRVMRTTGMMGELVGYAAALCKKYNCQPKDIYLSHLAELEQIISGLPFVK